MRKCIFAIAILFIFVCLTGCETFKGFKKDVSNVYDKAKEGDDWFQENYW